jgi:hypothetical protein
MHGVLMEMLRLDIVLIVVLVVQLWVRRVPCAMDKLSLVMETLIKMADFVVAFLSVTFAMVGWVVHVVVAMSMMNDRLMLNSTFVMLNDWSVVLSWGVDRSLALVMMRDLGLVLVAECLVDSVLVEVDGLDVVLLVVSVIELVMGLVSRVILTASMLVSAALMVRAGETILMFTEITALVSVSKLTSQMMTATISVVMSTASVFISKITSVSVASVHVLMVIEWSIKVIKTSSVQVIVSIIVMVSLSVSAWSAMLVMTSLFMLEFKWGQFITKFLHRVVVSTSMLLSIMDSSMLVAFALMASLAVGPVVRRLMLLPIQLSIMICLSFQI